MSLAFGPLLDWVADRPTGRSKARLDRLSFCHYRPLPKQQRQFGFALMDPFFKLKEPFSVAAAATAAAVVVVAETMEEKEEANPRSQSTSPFAASLASTCS